MIDPVDNFPLPGAEDPPPEPPAAAGRASASGAGAPSEGKRAKMAKARLRERAADEALELVTERYEIRRQPDGTAFIIDKRTGVCTDFAQGTAHVGRILSACVFEACGAVLKAAEKADLVEHLSAQAYSHGEAAELHLRSGPHASGSVIDLAEPHTSRAIEVMPHAWRVVDRAPIHFRRTRRSGVLPVPARGGSVETFRELLGWSQESSDGDFRRVIAWCLASVLRVGDVPVLLIRGGQGTGKSRLARMVLGLVDPATDDGLVSPPRDEDQLVISAAASWVMAWDNLSRVQEWLSDALCRAVTGGSLIRRRLYSDADLMPISVRRAIIVTTIGTDALRGDLAERVVLVEPPQISPTARRDENELDAAFANARPALLGALLDMAARVLSVLPTAAPPRLHRMAAYSRLCFALDSITGWDTYGDLVGGHSALASETVEGDPVARALVAHVVPTPGSFFEGTVTELYEKLESHRPEHDKRWPESSPSLGSRIRRLEGPLREQGIVVTHDRSRTGRTVRIERIEQDAADVAAP